MNKKFSTLLAAFLVAGGLGSSAFAQSTGTYPINKYVQLQINGGTLIIEESADRDSLGYAKSEYKKDLYSYNQTLWRFVVEAKKGPNGLPNGYNVYLQNKVYGDAALTKVDANPENTAYYAPGAVVSTAKLLLPGANYIPATATTSGKVEFTGDVPFAGDVVYDASSKTLKYYYLIDQNGVIKLMVEESTDSDFNPKTDLASESALSSAKARFKAKCERNFSSDIITARIRTSADALDLGIAGLNNIGNNAFDLTFTEDISANAKYANPFTASSLHASEYETYKAASYTYDDDDATTTLYADYLKDAKDEVAALKQLKTDVASFVKEMKVAIDEDVDGGVFVAVGASGLDESNSSAPNAENIFLVMPKNDLLKRSSEIGSLYMQVETLAGLATTTKYDDLATKEAVDALVKKLDDSLEAINKGLDEVIKAAETAVASFDEAVRNSMTPYQIKDHTEKWVDYKNFAAYDKDDDDALDALDLVKKAVSDYLNTNSALNKLYVMVPGVDGVAVPAGITVVVSAKTAEDPDLADYYPLEVVGETDTYVTVDTLYAADQEKYLTLNTVKLDKIAINKSTKLPLLEDEEFDKNTDTYVLIPTAGHNITPALFKVSVSALSVSDGDIITIEANAPKTKTIANKKWFNQYDETCYDNGLKIAIRTLAGAREASVMVPEEDPAVLKNTKITFAEPVLAAKINDGDIYFIINKNVRDKADYGKYAVVDPIVFAIENEYSYAKEAYVNVPGTQWYVEKNNDTYELKNRDYDKNYKVGTGKIYVVDEENMLYTTTARDTFQLVAANAEKEGHVGYKYISEEIQKISEFALSAINYANMETPYYLAFDGNEDSVLTTTSNKEEALALIPMIKDGKQVTEEYKMNDENLSKQFYQLIAKDGKDTLYLNISSSNELIVTKEVPSEDNPAYYLQFRSINDEPNAYEVLLATYDEDYDQNGGYNASKKLSYNQDGEAVVIDKNTAAAFVYDLVDNSSDIYKNFGFEGSTKVIISLNGDAESKVTKIGPFATVKRTGLDETIDADYSLIMDTAYVDHKDNIRYAYYITKPIVAADTAWNAEKFYLVSYADSVTANRSNDTIKYSQDGLTRIGFVAAKRLGTDSLAITKAVGATAADTLNVTEELGVTNATFAFAIDENNDEAYRIEVAPTKYVSYLNGILVEGAKEQAQLFNVNATDLTPTDNEEISVEAGVQVIGGKGAVTVQGAAGKTVTVYNFQGRALASTTLTSDNQTIAVPAGLVAVSVEGEPEAISVVVK